MSGSMIAQNEASNRDKRVMMDEWQDIESAPKDGTWILIRGRNSANFPMIPVVCAWRDGAWRDSASLRDMTHLVIDVPADGTADWLPLPQPPSNRDGD